MFRFGFLAVWYYWAKHILLWDVFSIFDVCHGWGDFWCTFRSPQSNLAKFSSLKVKHLSKSFNSTQPQCWRVCPRARWLNRMRWFDVTASLILFTMETPSVWQKMLFGRLKVKSSSSSVDFVSPCPSLSLPRCCLLGSVLGSLLWADYCTHLPAPAHLSHTSSQTHNHHNGGDSTKKIMSRTFNGQRVLWLIILVI